MITKAVVRRQLESGQLTNIMTIVYSQDGSYKFNPDNTPACANGIETCANRLGMTVTNEVSVLENAEIHIATWVK